MTRRPALRCRRPVAIVAGVLIALSCAAQASGFLSSTGAGTAAARVGSVDAPGAVAAQQAGADVSITWSAARLASGAGVEGYRVTRAGGATVCGDTVLVATLSCTDSDAPGGSHAYTVTAVFRSFTASATTTSVAGLTAPTIGAKPANPSAASLPSISFSGGGGSGYACRFGDAAFNACTSPAVFSGAGLSGAQTFEVRATEGGAYGPEASYAWTIDDSAPAIATKPSDPSADTAPPFAFSHSEPEYTFECKLDAAAYAPCTSPSTPSGLADGSHTFRVRAADADGVSTAATVFTWVVHTAPPTQSLALASTSGASLSGGTLYYRGSAAGSFKLLDTVASSIGAASAAFPDIATTGWTHAVETVATPSGGPYASSLFSWSAGPATPTGYAVTATDALGLTSHLALTFVDDATAPTAGTLVVNGAAAGAAGAVSQSASAAFPIVRTDFAEAQSATQSGLTSSTLTVQSASLGGPSYAPTCGAAGSGGPFTTAVTITATTQPAGIVTGNCYVYTLTGTDKVGNAAAVSTTVQVTPRYGSVPLHSVGKNNQGCGGYQTPAGPVIGTVFFYESGGDVKVHTELTNAPPGANYGFAVRCVAFLRFATTSAQGTDTFDVVYGGAAGQTRQFDFETTVGGVSRYAVTPFVVL